jgi:hypothetical protein
LGTTPVPDAITLTLQYEVLAIPGTRSVLMSVWLPSCQSFSFHLQAELDKPAHGDPIFAAIDNGDR